MKTFYGKVYDIVKQIPFGKVTSYGHIALLIGKPNAARAVGYALKAIPLELKDEIPWHRVINSKGEISIKNKPGADILQKKNLEEEGIVFENGSKVDLNKFGWFPN